ncbi:MAG: matrixin family metalloprotease [Candidatus Binatia bacterium]
MRRAFLAGALASLWLVTPGDAYVLKDDGHGHALHWRRMPVSYLLVADNVPGGAAGEDAVHRAFRSWTAASESLRYEFGGYASEGVQRNDGRNIVYWVHTGWPFDSRLAAVTFHYYDTSDGHLVDADVVFNGDRYPWSVDSAGYDIENSAAHEAGHFGGLGHSAETEATMFAATSAGETKKRTLHADDVAGIEAVYGGTNDASSSGLAGESDDGGPLGGCFVGGSAERGGVGELLALAAALAVLRGRRAASRLRPPSPIPRGRGSRCRRGS